MPTDIPCFLIILAWQVFVWGYVAVMTMVWQRGELSPRLKSYRRRDNPVEFWLFFGQVAMFLPALFLAQGVLTYGLLKTPEGQLLAVLLTTLQSAWTLHRWGQKPPTRPFRAFMWTALGQGAALLLSLAFSPRAGSPGGWGILAAGLLGVLVQGLGLRRHPGRST